MSQSTDEYMELDERIKKLEDAEDARRESNRLSDLRESFEWELGRCQYINETTAKAIAFSLMRSVREFLRQSK